MIIKLFKKLGRKIVKTIETPPKTLTDTSGIKKAEQGNGEDAVPYRLRFLTNKIESRGGCMKELDNIRGIHYNNCIIQKHNQLPLKQPV